MENAFTWSQDNVGNLYISSTLTTMDPNQSYQVQKRTDQNVDANGNVLNVFQYDWNSLTTPARVYTYTYLNSSAYTSRYILQSSKLGYARHGESGGRNTCDEHL